MRTRSSLINLTAAMAGQVISIAITFLARMVFIRILGAEYLGLNGLFTNILSVLSLIELGIGPAIIYSLYKPLAEKDIEKIKSLMKFYKKAYVAIGVMILLLGISFTPFLGFVIHSFPITSNTKLIFLLFVCNAAITYFYSYKRSLIISDQKRYLATIYRYAFFIALNIAQIIILISTHNFILFLLCQLVATFLENVLVSKKADKLYPYLKENNVQKIDKLTLGEIGKNVYAMVAHKLGGVVVNSTDNLVISKYIGLNGVGLYSNYQLIINALNIAISQVFTSITASVGNLGATESNEKKREIFNVVFFLNFWIYGFISTGLVVLFNPFIEIWVGKDYVLEKGTVLIIVLNFYLSGMRSSVLTFRDALGLYWYDRYKPIFESIINVVTSLILIQYVGMVGVFIATTISYITCLWVEPFVLYKYGFRLSAFPFFKKYLLYVIAAISACIITVQLSNIFVNNSKSSFIFILCICVFVPNVMFLIFFHRTKEFIDLYSLLNRIFLIKIREKITKKLLKRSM